MRDRLYSLIDLTSLNDSDDADVIAMLCSKAVSSLGHVAAVCVYPAFIQQCTALLKNQSVKVATVVNFPHGDDPLDQVKDVIQQAIQQGADEIDVVFPYRRYLSGKKEGSFDFVHQCKKACGDSVLKVILETGAFPDTNSITDAAQGVILAGADFIKTSTGKISVGATLDAAQAMLLVIKNMAPLLSHEVGLKVSGGIRTTEQATQYVTLAEGVLGPDWVTSQHMRIGASQLVDALLINELSTLQ